ncbi:MAG: NAD-dependent succinate-semialdehyde dehydrogenase [Candidatus Micrarchaeota archaeon]|nr:NAD-dependent succinate-semialdehyde dehydrogenase [Candidatus Micrarchaeota archaeon]MDE1804430.1 NAD-dependent succinate-semialdehyde dehydrogenase [Candidatus Micrarchaeota archaeon]MDE1847202.1 NAD-dependent succinate-semialdehyde dehydrogenase [Candidatus Micrarchaeota archaeon]
MKINSVNPATEEVNGEFEVFDRKAAVGVAKLARAAFKEWGNEHVDARARHLLSLSEVLTRNRERYARLITIEMGKPIKQALAEIDKCAATAQVYAKNGREWLSDEQLSSDGTRHMVAFEPLGTILSVMPWNFPFWQALRFAIPALTVGNTSVLRHSNAVPMCALAIEEAFVEAGFPQNTFRTVITDHRGVGALIRSSHIDGVSVTGGLGVGQEVGKMAGKMVKKFVLELGGNDPFIVLDDADLNFTCRNAAIARMQNTGQSCIAAKRFIVTERIAEQFTANFKEEVERMRVGNPLEMSTDIGPLANAQQVETLESQVRDAADKGGRIILGGKRIGGKGAFFEPTIITNVSKRMRVLREEVFGPVAPIIVVKDEKQAIRVANDSDLGLGASIWTEDAEKAEAIARSLEVGMVFVNSIVKSDPYLPFGGIKKSGIGRELSKYGLREFANVKAINFYPASHTHAHNAE